MSGSSNLWRRLPLRRGFVVLAVAAAVAVAVVGANSGVASAAPTPTYSLTAVPKSAGVNTFELQNYSAAYIDVAEGPTTGGPYGTYFTVDNKTKRDVASLACVTYFQAFDANGNVSGPEGSVTNPANCPTSTPTVSVTPTVTASASSTSVSASPTGSKSTSSSATSSPTVTACNNDPKWSDLKDHVDHITLTYTSTYIGKLPLCEGVRVPASYNGFYAHGPSWQTSGDQQWRFWEPGFLTRENSVVVHLVPQNYNLDCYFQLDPNHSNHAYDGKDGALPHYNDVFTPVNTVEAVNGGTKLCIDDHPSSSPAPSGSESGSSSVPATSSAPASSSASHTTVPSSSMSVGTHSGSLTPGHVIVKATGGLDAGGHTVLQYTIFPHSGSIMLAGPAGLPLLVHTSGSSFGAWKTLVVLLLIALLLSFNRRRAIVQLVHRGGADTQNSGRRH